MYYQSPPIPLALVRLRGYVLQNDYYATLEKCRKTPTQENNQKKTRSHHDLH